MKAAVSILNPLAIKIAATQAKSACADWDLTGAGRFCNCCREFIRRFQLRIGIAVMKGTGGFLQINRKNL